VEALEHLIDHSPPRPADLSSATSSRNWGGWLYVAFILDAYNRMVVGGMPVISVPISSSTAASSTITSP